MIAGEHLPFEKKKKKTDKELWRTICCMLAADEETREFLWKEMEKYTLLVNELIIQVSQLDDFKKWQGKGSIAKRTVEKLCKSFQNDQDDQRFQGLSCRFYASAILMVTYTYQSWFELQQKRLWKLNGKKRYLKAVEDDIELAKVTDFNPQQVQARAQAILEEFDRKQAPRKTDRSTKQSGQLKSSQNEDLQEDVRSLFTFLFSKHQKEKNPLGLRAIVHLLKNEGKVNQDEEDYERLLLKLSEKREKISRLEKQLESRLPKGRDITENRSAKLLKEAVEFLPKHPICKPPLFLFKAFLAYLSEQVDYVKYGVYLLESIVQEFETTQIEFFTWEDSVFEHLVNVSKIPNLLPYPVIFGSASDVYWSSFERTQKEVVFSSEQSSETQNVKIKTRKRPSKRRRKQLKTRSNERISVRFKGFGERIFKIECDRRKLPIFKQFLIDWQTLMDQSDEEKFSLGLFALRSAYLTWKPDEQELYKHKKSKHKFNESEHISGETEQASPWQTHRLYLHCVIDLKLLTAEGTEEVRQEKIKKTEEAIDKAEKEERELEEKLNHERLSANERKDLESKLISKRKKISSSNTSLIRLRRSTPPRPSRASYSGNSDRVMAIAFCVHDLAGAVIFDSSSQQTLAECTLESLLVQEVNQPKLNQSVKNLRLEQYNLVERLRNGRKQRPVQRREEQKLDKYFEGHSESNLGQYLERLVAARAIETAKQWNVGIIIIPTFEGIRESIESAIWAKAKKLFPNQKELQREYGKEARKLNNGWSFNRFSECIRDCALKGGISVQTHQQPVNSDLTQKAIGLAQKGNSSLSTKTK